MMNRKLLILPATSLLAAPVVLAHCPLCTIGAGAAAGIAAYYGVKHAVIVFLGAFAASMGWWVAGLLKKQYVKGQKWLLVALSYVTTILPLLPLLGKKEAFMISLFGGYGTLLNRTYMYDAMPSCGAASSASPSSASRRG